MNSLPENTEFVKIIRYRSYSGKDKDMLELKTILGITTSTRRTRKIKQII